jgi:hypothetical protein
VKSALQNARAQIVQSTLDRDNSGQATARMTLLIAPEESDAVIARIKAMGRVQNFNLQTERVAQNGSGMSDTAKVERDKVQPISSSRAQERNRRYNKPASEL